MKLTATVLTPDAFSRLLGDLRAAYTGAGWLTVTYSSDKPRSIDQNSISHAWYSQIAAELREDDELGWKCYCKLHHGVPILRAGDEEFRGVYDKAIKSLTYEQKLGVMRILPVTSLMTKPQLSAYLEAVQADFLARGVALEFPQERAA